MSRVKLRTRMMRHVGNSFWYEMVYLAMCLAAAAFHANTRTSGVWLGSFDKYDGEVQRYVLCPMTWKSESGFVVASGGGVIEGSIVRM